VASTPEDAVRNYLRWRQDPSSVQPDTADLDARIEAEDDPVERVKLRSERSRLADLGPRLEADFVTHVRAWADEHQVTAEALLEEGVDRRSLAQAGMLTGTPRTPRSAATAVPRSPRVRREDVAAHVRGLRRGTTVTTSTIANDAGGSPATVRKVLDDLAAEGVVVEDGKDHSGPGRPRTLYRRT
jgi:hypothetical protein